MNSSHFLVQRDRPLYNHDTVRYAALSSFKVTSFCVLQVWICEHNLQTTGYYMKEITAHNLKVCVFLACAFIFIHIYCVVYYSMF